ncbi:flagellin [Zooshikella marina]|uniref:flagellin N-terminal helical domain-containing protein n=1 Tax=Zooshikella ganghwensis TaxID=202772 RepID=UPI000409ED9F|nr:flagellin [Zooshikella ganghwensis]MBU2706811.1 flagellin [Zooshikella ganghwensis]
MPQVINTNLASLSAQRYLDISQSAKEQAMQRLSSGLRINSAKDDAAGLAISTRFTSQIRGTTVAIQNANNGISLAQTAEGALNSIASNLQRVRELALQSANGSNTDIDRDALNQEVQQLVAEIQSVADKTNFNGKNLLDGSFSNALFQTGANLGDTISVSIERTSTDSLGTALEAGISSTLTGNSQLNAGDLVINGIAVGASSGSDDTSSTNYQERGAIAKAAAINKISEQTGVIAKVNAATIAGGTYANTDDKTGQITINGVTIDLVTDNALSTEANLEAVVTAINEKSGQTGVVASFDGNATTGITMVAEDGRNVDIQNVSGNASADFGLATGNTTYFGTFTLISQDGEDINIDSTTGNIDNAGLEVGSFSGVNGGSVGDNVTSTALSIGDLVINGVAVGASLTSFDSSSTTGNAASAIAKAAAINAVSEKSGVTAKANATIVTGGTITTGTAQSGNVVINGVDIQIAYGANDSASDIQNTIINAVNSKSGQTGVKAEAFGSTFRLTADDGRNIDVSAINTVANAGFSVATTYSSVSLTSAGQFTLTSNTGSISRAGFQIGTFGGQEAGQLLDDLDISTLSGANDALISIDNAISKVSEQISALGALQNRFLSTVSNLSVNSENLSAANSRILDADFAAETAEMSRATVLQQAGISVLAQANAQPQQVLSLLQ